MPDIFAKLVKEISHAIDRMGTDFDTHELILELARENQPAYIRALNESVESGSAAPFKVVHAAIGRSLKRHSHEFGIQEIETGKNHSSPDIFGESCSCSKWKKT
ncbi:MAG: hypothetical protein ABSA59_22825 [Terriglobia bacterium]|jgi:hypothetical protein